MSGAQSAHLVNLLLDGAQTPPANLCADSTSCCWIVRRLLRLVPGARLVDRRMLSVLYLVQFGQVCARWARISRDLPHSPCLDCDQLEGLSGRAFYDYESDRLGQFVQT